MEDRKGRVRPRRWKNLEEELEALENDPDAKALLDLLAKQDPGRVEQLMEELTELAEKEEPSHED